MTPVAVISAICFGVICDDFFKKNPINTNENSEMSVLKKVILSADKFISSPRIPVIPQIKTIK